MNNPLISIIIPTYNRANLISETLDSVLAQTYTNWECIVVDDGSTDNTEEVLNTYVDKDSRFQYRKRPVDRKKGANACRNHGFKLSKGSYINWFDSDDIMLPNNLKLRVNAFEDKIGFVIGNTVNFDENGNESRPFVLDYSYPIEVDRFVSQQIGWITNDVLLRKEVAGLVSFDERLKSGQEYNYFSRLLYLTNNGKYLKEDIARRRIHLNSITTTKLNKSVEDFNLNLFKDEFILFNQIKGKASVGIKNRFIKRLIRFSYYGKKSFTLCKFQLVVIGVLFSEKRVNFLLKYVSWTLLNLTLGKGYFLIKKII